MSPRKQPYRPTFAESMLKLHRAGVDTSPDVRKRANGWEELETLQERMEKLFGIVNKKQTTDMLFFVMDDIESNKVRSRVAKYLLKMGCFRIQRSIFLANLSTREYEQIRIDLTEVQACYDKKDSILIVPASTDILRAMRVIGQDISVDLITQSQTTIFF